MLHALPGKEIEIPRGPLKIVVAMMNPERYRFEGRMNRKGHVEVLRGRENRIVSRVAMRYPGNGERTYKRAFASVLNRSPKLAGCFRRVAQRQMGDRNEASAGIAAEVCDPSVVCAAIGAGEFGIEQFRLPEQSDGGVEERLLHAFLVEELEAFLHNHRAEGRTFQISVFGFRLYRAHVLRTGCATPHRRFAHALGFLDPLTHAAQRAQEAGGGHLGALPVYFQVLKAVIADPDAHRAIAIPGVDVFLPQIRWLQDLTVAVDNLGVSFHVNSPVKIRLLERRPEPRPTRLRSDSRARRYPARE